MIADLEVFFEYLVDVFGGDADTGIPYLDQRFLAAPADGDQDAAMVGVFDGVADQVAEQAEQQLGIGKTPPFR